MSRFIASALSVTVMFSFVDAARPQFLQTGRAGADTYDTAGANTFSTAGPSSQTTIGVPPAGPAGPIGQPGIRPYAPGGAATARFNQAFGTTTFGAPYPTAVFYSATPWFSSPALRQQLQLNAIQYHHLYSAYVDAYSRYNQAVSELPANMLLAERAGQLQTLADLYYGQFNDTLEATVTNPDMLQNFNTLRAEYVNRPPSGVPVPQPALGLTPEQHRRLSLMAYQWNQLAAQLRERIAADESVPPKDITTLNSEAEEQIKSTLTPEQQPIWRQIVGQYYDLDAPKTKQPPPTSDEQSASPQSPAKANQSAPNQSEAAPE